MDSSGNMFISEVFSEAMVVISAFHGFIWSFIFNFQEPLPGHRNGSAQNNRISHFVKADRPHPRKGTPESGSIFPICSDVLVGWRENISHVLKPLFPNGFREYMDITWYSCSPKWQDRPCYAIHPEAIHSPNQQITRQNLICIPLKNIEHAGIENSGPNVCSR